MALRYSGQTHNTLERYVLEAFDGSKRVAVKISTEVIEDRGLEAAKTKATEKYDRGSIEPDGSVQVLNTDF